MGSAAGVMTTIINYTLILFAKLVLMYKVGGSGFLNSYTVHMHPSRPVYMYCMYILVVQNCTVQTAPPRLQYVYRLTILKAAAYLECLDHQRLFRQHEIGSGGRDTSSSGGVLCARRRGSCISKHQCRRRKKAPRQQK